jgi:SAM-dependent methyltransferase
LETKVPGTIEEHVRLRERLETAPGSTNTHSRLLSVYMDAHYGNSADEYEMFRLFRVGDHFWKNALTLIEACNFINALDLGCCVGRYTFELARRSAVAIGIDLNFTYLSAAAKIQRTRQVQWEKSIDGNQYQDQEHQVAVPENVLFVLADAMDPPFEPLSFDITCALNLLDAVSVPLALIAQMDALLKYGGQTILCSPYEWRADITKPEEWLVSPNADSAKIVRQILTGEKFSHLELKYVIDTEIQQVPWLLRNHSRYWSLFLVHMLKAHKM